MANELLIEALIASMEGELETIPLNLKDYHIFSKEFEQKMKRLIKKSNIK